MGNQPFREVSTVLSWPIKITERFSIEPSIADYNALGKSSTFPSCKWKCFLQRDQITRKSVSRFLIDLRVLRVLSVRG
jgi:hypothetical protein